MKQICLFFDKYLYIISIIIALIGFIILCIFMYLLSFDYRISGRGIQLQDTGQVGDFIGGVVGSIWSFSSILLIFLTFKLQKIDIKEQRKEFHINRITSIVYFQLERIEKVIDNTPMTKVSNEYNNNKMQFISFAKTNLPMLEIGKISIDELSEMTPENILSVAKKNRNLIQTIKIHEDYVLIIINALHNSIDVLKSTLARKDLDVSELNSLKDIYFKNIGYSFLDIFKTIELIFFNHGVLLEFVNSGGLNDSSLEEEISNILVANNLFDVFNFIKNINEFRNKKITESFLEAQINEDRRVIP